MKRLKIVSDGTGPGTHVYDADGKELHGITRVSWSIEPGRFAVVTLDCLAEIEAAGKAVVNVVGGQPR